MSIALTDLVGVQALDGVDYGDYERKDYAGYTQKANVMRIRLCGITYVFEEDPDDGYRSTLGDARIAQPDEPPIKNVIPLLLVDCKMSDDTDVLQIYDRVNGKLIIEVGTDHSDRYYPTCVMNWNPENLHFNDQARSTEGS